MTEHSIVYSSIEFLRTYSKPFRGPSYFERLKDITAVALTFT